MSIELHCHTLFSIDGSGTPEQLVAAAAAAGVTTLAITEHNHLGSTARGAAAAAQHNIRYMAGIEMDAFFEGRSYHILGFGIDPENCQLQARALANHSFYETQFERQMAVLQELEFPLTRAEVEAALPGFYPTHPAPVCSRYAINFLIRDKGLTGRLQELHPEVMRLTEAAAPLTVSFGSFAEIVAAIHAAGGVALLAHVGKYFPDNQAAQTETIRRMMAQGLDGFELYHHSNMMHSDIAALQQLGQELGCLFSGGSDCHHAPCEAPRQLGKNGLSAELARPLFERVGL